MGLSIYDERYPTVESATIVPADTTTKKQLCALRQQPRRVDSILMLSNDSAAHTVVVSMNDGTKDMDISTYSLPAGTGFGSLPPADFVVLRAPASIAGYVLPSGYTLSVRSLDTVGVGLTLFFTALGGYV